MRRLRNEMYSLLTVLAVPAILASVFPYSALGFKAKAANSACGGFAAFTTLSAEAEAAAIRSAKTSWHGENAGGERFRAELRLGELPEPDASPVLSIASRNRPAPGPRPELPMPPYLPSWAAGAPARLSADAMLETPPAFSRQELLEIH